MNPIYDENGEIVEFVDVTPLGTVVVPIKKMKDYEKVFTAFFEDKPEGTAVVYTNSRGDVLEVQKKGDDLYDAIHHFKKGGQEAVRNLNHAFTVCELAMGEYDFESMKEIDGPLDDQSEKTETTAKTEVVEAGDGTKELRVHLEQKAPDGEVQVLDKTHVLETEKSAKKTGKNKNTFDSLYELTGKKSGIVSRDGLAFVGAWNENRGLPDPLIGSNGEGLCAGFREESSMVFKKKQQKKFGDGLKEMSLKLKNVPMICTIPGIGPNSLRGMRGTSYEVSGCENGKSKKIIVLTFDKWD